MLDFSLCEESSNDLESKKNELYSSLKLDCEFGEEDFKLPKVADYLRAEGLLPECECDDTNPVDITVEQLVFPAPRSARLQTMARGMTGAVTALGYAAIRGFGPAHPTVGELRTGFVEVALSPKFEASDDADTRDAYYLGEIKVTEVESLFSNESVSEEGENELGFNIGYGMVMGGCETKAIAMSVLDNCLEKGDDRYPTGDEEFVLYHIDGVEATGFISHLKLPHYVTFQSKLSSARKTHEHPTSPEGEGSTSTEVLNEISEQLLLKEEIGV